MAGLENKTGQVEAESGLSRSKNFRWTKTTSQDASCSSRNMANPSIAEAREEPQPAVTFLPEVYVKANDLQRKTNIRTLERFGINFKSRPSADQQFIDIGCGTGDFTRQELLQRCQPCRRIVATDIGESMVTYAKENFAHPQIEYQVHDISIDVSGLVKKYGQFNRVYSFYTLHFAKDYVTAFRNISDLMTSGGECLLLFVARWTGYEVWRTIAQMDRWKAYEEISEKFIPDSHDLEDNTSLISYMLDILETVNLKPHACRILTNSSLVEDLEDTIRMNIAVHPFLPLLPVESRARYKDDVENVIRSHWKQSNDGDPHYDADMFVIHAEKS